MGRVIGQLQVLVGFLLFFSAGAEVQRLSNLCGVHFVELLD